MWIDEDLSASVEHSSVSMSVRRGRNAHSGYVDKKMKTAFDKILRAVLVVASGVTDIRYPKFEACRRVCASLKNPRCQSEGLGWVGHASGMAPRAIALNPFCIELDPEGNCFLSLFRKCEDPGGIIVGPISANMVVQSGLFDTQEMRLLSETDRAWIGASDNHCTENLMG